MTNVRTITVTGQGSAAGRPDRITISMGVRVREATASGALTAANTAARALIDELRSAGVDERNIATPRCIALSDL
jgi:uncharacterized protein